MTARIERQRYYDGLAIGASLLCLIHCLLLPMIVILLPAVAAFLIVPESFHAWALAFAFPTSAYALVSGYRRHRTLLPAVIVAPGLTLLAFGALGSSPAWIETALTVPGALLLAIGHAVNWRSLRAAGLRHRPVPDDRVP